MIYLLLVILLLVYSVINIKKIYGPNSLFAPKTNGKKDESLETLIDRLDYANNIMNKINTKAWIIFSAIILSFFIVLYVYGGIPSAHQFVVIIFISSTILLGLNSFYEHHIIKFIHYFTDRNIRYIRNKLSLKFKGNLQPNYVKDHRCDYYIYKNL